MLPYSKNTIYTLYKKEASIASFFKLADKLNLFVLNQKFCRLHRQALEQYNHVR